jgi:ureidoglycolate lyase
MSLSEVTNINDANTKKNITIKAMPLTVEAFKPFGDVIEVADRNQKIEINYGLTTRHHDLATVDTLEQGGKPIVSIFEATAGKLEHSAKVMERHPLGSQAFFPLGSQPYLVVVGRAGDFDVNALSAFIVQPDQGVNYHRGVWHHYCLPLHANMNFLVVDRGGEGHNCDEVNIPESMSVTIA